MTFKKMINVLARYITDKDYRFQINAAYGKYNNMPDEEYLKRQFKARMGYELDLENPKTFNEKLQWLKLYDRNPKYTMMVDKYKVREYIKEQIGEDYLIPLIGVWDDPEDIDFDSLPNQFVLKCNHNSGTGMCICKDKTKLDIKKVKKELKKGLSENYFLGSREWPYKDVPRKIICEKYMEDNTSGDLKDYKIFCFDSIPKVLFIASDRQKKNTETKFDFFDMNFNHLEIENGHPNANVMPNCPKNFEEMKKLAKILSEDIPQLRVDFYEINGKTFFGELTFSHWSGMVPFSPDKWDCIFGNWIKLPNKNAQIRSSK